MFVRSLAVIVSRRAARISIYFIPLVSFLSTELYASMYEVSALYRTGQDTVGTYSNPSMPCLPQEECIAIIPRMARIIVKSESVLTWYEAACMHTTDSRTESGCCVLFLILPFRRAGTNLLVCGFGSSS